MHAPFRRRGPRAFSPPTRHAPPRTILLARLQTNLLQRYEIERRPLTVHARGDARFIFCSRERVHVFRPVKCQHYNNRSARFFPRANSDVNRLIEALASNTILKIIEKIGVRRVTRAGNSSVRDSAVILFFRVTSNRLTVQCKNSFFEKIIVSI